MTEGKKIYTVCKNICNCTSECDCSRWAVYEEGRLYFPISDRKKAEKIALAMNSVEERRFYKPLEISGIDIAGMIARRHLSVGECIEFPESKLTLKLAKE